MGTTSDSAVGRGVQRGVILRRLATGVALAYGAGAVLTQVVLTRRFSHTASYLQLLGELAWLPWVLGALAWSWAAALVWRRGRLPGAAPIGPQLDRGGRWIAALWGLALLPFFSAYASHVVLPAVALGACLFLWASGQLIPWQRRGLERALAHPLAPAIAALCAGAWYFTVSYYRHANFGSGSRDMGLFFQTVWLLSQGLPPHNTVMGMHAFADHMELIDVLMVPLVWLWRDAGALLLAQALVTGSGVAAVMRLTRRRTGDGLAALLMGASYFLAYPIAQGVQFDWNPTTMATGLLAWAFDLADRRRVVPLLGVLLLIGLCKENLWLYVAAFGAFLIVAGNGWRLGLGVLGGAAVIFGVELKLVFPLFREQGFRHFYWRQLGESFGAVAANAVASPLRAVSLLVTPGDKVNGLLLPFSGTAWLGLWAPAPLIVAVPGIAERFWGDFHNAWWGHHYGGPTAVVAVVAAIHALPRLAAALGPWFGRWLPGAAPLRVLASLCLVATVLSDVAGRWSPVDLFVLEKPYLPAAEERPAMRRAIAAVPPGVSVAAQDYFLAHLAARVEAYELSRTAEAEVVVVNLTTNPWPHDRAFIEALVRRLLRSGDYGLSFCERNSWVLARGAPQPDGHSCPALEALLSRP